MDASQLPKGKSREKNTEGRSFNEPGIYVHTDTGAKFITSEGEEGTVQADQLMNPLWQNAWQRIGDVPTRLELLAMRKAQEVKDNTEEALQKGKEAAELKEATKKALEAAKEAEKEPAVV